MCCTFDQFCVDAFLHLYHLTIEANPPIFVLRSAAVSAVDVLISTIDYFKSEMSALMSATCVEISHSVTEKRYEQRARVETVRTRERDVVQQFYQAQRRSRTAGK